MTDPDQTNIQKAYDAFNRRDIDSVLLLLHPDVRWPNGWEGGYVTGHEAVRAYWTRQWQELDPEVRPEAFDKTADGRMAVTVRQTVKDKQGTTVFDGLVKHIYTVKDGLIRSMEIESS